MALEGLGPGALDRQGEREPAAHGEFTIVKILGLDPAAVLSFLHGHHAVAAVHAANLRAHRLGINGVPCFVVAGRHAIAGAQEPEVIERLLDIAALDAAEF